MARPRGTGDHMVSASSGGSGSDSCRVRDLLATLRWISHFKARQAACRAALCLGGRLRASLGRELGLHVLSSPSSPFQSLPFANIWGRDSGIRRRLWGTSPSCVGPPTCLHLPSLADPSSSTLYIPCRGLSHRQGPRVTAQEPGASPGRRWPGRAASLGAATLAPL